MERKLSILRKLKMPEFCLSHWLLRIPLVIVFIQQGLMKIPVDIEEAASYGLSYLVWWFVAYGELLGGIGLIIGGLMDGREHSLADCVSLVIGSLQKSPMINAQVVEKLRSGIFGRMDGLVIALTGFVNNAPQAIIIY